MIGANNEHETVVEGLKSGSATAFSFGKYQLFASLGRGGMADVFLAVSRGPMGFNKLVVIKRLRPALAEEPAFRTMFLDEARLAARLNHPNVVHTYEVGEHGGIYFIAMEYLEGQSLNKVMKSAVRAAQMIEPVFCARIIADALTGVQHAHELRDYDGKPLTVIHRDVSPHNIFVTYDGHVKLVDFGIAKAANSSTETEVGVLKGKVAYMAPEQAMGGAIDHRVDLFAMGIVLWEMLTRQRLMTGDSAANTLHKLMNLPIPRVSSVKPDIDPRLDDLVAHALEKDPNRRFQSALEMRDALEAWISVTARPSRQDDVGRLITSLFQRTREEVQRQIQTHMAAVTVATSTGELQALTVDALKRLETSGSAKMLRLGGNGSGSGVISTYPPAEPSTPSVQSGVSVSGGVRAPNSGHPASVQPSNPSRGLWMALMLLLGASVMVIVVLLVKGRDKVDRPPVVLAPTNTTPSTVPVATGSALIATASATVAMVTPPIPMGSSVALVIPTPVPSTPTPRRNPTNPNVNRVQPTPPVAPTPPVQSDEGPGFLTLQPYPWMKVSEGGKVLGNSPLIKVPLSPGSHTLTLENSEKGLKKTYTVVIKSGETLARSPAYE